MGKWTHRGLEVGQGGRGGIRIWAVLTALTMVASGIGTIVGAPKASAWPAEIPHPETVAADGLPTVQIDGVVWAQAIVGDTVYVGGSFSEARPAGAGAGSGVPRSNMLAYNIVTGQLISSFAPDPNAQVRTITASPDGSHIYVGGDFTSIAGTSRSRIAAFSTATGALVTNFRPSVGYHVYDISVTASTVYVGGNFTNVGSQYRGRLAAFDTSGTLLSWAPDASDREVWAVQVSPDGSQVAVAGQFETLNGTMTFGRGLAVVDSVTGSIEPFDVTGIVRNGGVDGGITELFSDGDLLYGSGFTFGRSAGTLEGIFAARWGGGEVEWINDCHGDTHSVYVRGDVVYSAGHAHYCGNIDGFMQPNGTWDWYRGVAHTKQVAGTVMTERLGYTNFGGQPRPDLLNWFPSLSAGAYTGLEQGPWDVTGDSRYVVMGGEFLTVNGQAQQGLVRFPVRSNAPNDQGPQLFNDSYPIKARSFTPGTVTVSWQGNRDRDDATLRYRVFRRTGATGTGTVVHTRSVTAPWWDLPVMTSTDDTATGTDYQYRVQVDDGDNNFANSPWTAVGAAPAGSSYLTAVLASEPDSLWRLGESASATVASDTVGWRDATIPATGVTMGQQGAIIGDADTAGQFDGASTDSKVVSTTQDLTLPHIFSLEAWVRTASSDGGLIIGYNNTTTNAGSSSRHDRVLYMDTSGRLRFGVNPATPVAIGPETDFRDDQWHHVVGTLSPAGMRMYVDGLLVGQRLDITNARTGYVGNIRIGVGALDGFPGTDTTTGRRFEGLIDDAALYRKALTAQRIVAHYTASGRAPSGLNQAPVAQFVATPTGLSVALDGSGSWDADGTVESWDWDFGDGTPVTSTSTGSTSHVYSAAGTYTVSLTVTDDDGAGSTAFTRQVTVAAAPVNQVPVAQFVTTPNGLSVSFDGSGSSDADGTVASWAWSFGDGSPVSTDAGSTTHLYAAAGSYTVSLTVTDDDGAPSAAFTQPVNVVAPLNQEPVAQFVATATGSSVAFDGSGSWDADGTIASWAWDFGDGSPVSSAVGSTSHVYAAAGSYTVLLTVTDDDGASSGAFTDEVTIEPPVNLRPDAQFVAAATGLSVAFDGSGSSDANGTIASWAWTFGDGSSSTSATPTHVYAAAGTYVVALTVTDDDGATDSVAQSVTVVAPIPADADGDGVVDGRDACPTVAGPASSGGCPAPTPAPTPADSDGDGVVDGQDACPTVAGPASNGGCVPAPSAVVSVKAAGGKSKLYVNVNPNKGSGYWKFQVQRKLKDGSWRALGTYRTKGSKETRTINLKKGVYRVWVNPKYGRLGAFSREVSLRK